MHFDLSNRSNRRGRGWAGLRRFANDEEGAAYSLSFVMVIPIYALLMCLIIEAALILTAKLGTVYAAYAAARTASVWSSHTTWEKTMEKSQRSALKTMVPFASGTQGLLASAPPINADTATNGLNYWIAYQAYAKEPQANKYLAAKYGYASRNVKLSIEGPPEKSDSPISATVTYQFPFNIPGIARILGEKGPDGYFFNLSSTATIPNEGPQDDRKNIGIGYGTLE
jgi:Flp pilus assembly protein TadG